MDRESDFTDLMARAGSGDPEAIRDFLERFEQEVRVMVRARLPRKLRPRFDSGDFVQEVWQAVFAGPRDRPRPLEFENVAHLCGFLQGVVRNKVQEQHRRLTRTAKHNLAHEEPLYIARGDREIPREVASPDPSPSENVQADDRLEQLMAGFGPREIEVLTLRRQGLTYAEVAERTGMHERSVRRIIELFRVPPGGPRMISDAHTVLAATRPLRDEPGDVVAPRGASPRVGGDRASLSSRAGASGRRRRPIGVGFAPVGAAVGRPRLHGGLGGAATRRRSRTTSAGWTPPTARAPFDLIYREFCLAEADGRAPVADAYVARFPRHAEALRRLFQVHGACSPSLLHRLLGPPRGSERDPWASGESAEGLPEAGDSIGPYVLRRELGRGSFARVFLAEQADLANRLVVVKIATRATREPWLLAKARHAHIVEILSHAEVDDGAFQLISMPFWGGATLADVLAAPAPPSRPASRPGSSLASGSAGHGQGGGATAPPGPRAVDRRRPAGGPRRRRRPRVSVGAPGAAGARSWRRCRTTGRSPG